MKQWHDALLKAQLAPRCGARTRSGKPCKAPAMKNGRCRMHGGKSTGAPLGKRHGRYKHGKYTNDVLAFNSHLKALIRKANQLVEEI